MISWDLRSPCTCTPHTPTHLQKLVNGTFTCISCDTTGGYWVDSNPANGTSPCKACAAGCTSCNSSAPSACTACNSTQFLMSGQCKVDCDAGYIKNMTTHVCVQVTAGYASNGTTDTATPCGVGVAPELVVQKLRINECAMIYDVCVCAYHAFAESSHSTVEILVEHIHNAKQTFLLHILRILRSPMKHAVHCRPALAQLTIAAAVCSAMQAPIPMALLTLCVSSARWAPFPLLALWSAVTVLQAAIHATAQPPTLAQHATPPTSCWVGSARLTAMLVTSRM